MDRALALCEKYGANGSIKKRRPNKAYPKRYWYALVRDRWVYIKGGDSAKRELEIAREMVRERKEQLETEQRTPSELMKLRSLPGIRRTGADVVDIPPIRGVVGRPK